MNRMRWEALTPADPIGVMNLNRTAFTATLVGNKVFLVGGLQQFGNSFNGLYALDLAKNEWRAWRLLDICDFNARAHFYSRRAHVAEVVDDKIYFLGGYDKAYSAAFMVTALDLVSMKISRVTTEGPFPGKLGCFTGNLLPLSDTIVLYGGELHYNEYPRHPLIGFSTSRRRWRRIPFRGAPPALKKKQASCFVEQKLYLYGGINMEETLGSLHILDFATPVPVWSTPRNGSIIPPERFGTFLLRFKGKLYVFGGKQNLDVGMESRLGDLWTFHLDKELWEPVTVTEGTPPSRRSNHNAIISGSTIVLFGGTQAVLRNVHKLHLDDEF